ncbi:flippase [Halostagnicola kamekurae]|uniref:Membrane protein involved in the export of O-antigen and teichoic acid n=1 Tax=Halostagnicola kamekurae TaxID=619731 RepID=A0A1I6UHA7_9EURY|nr:flippase [Halostagnicola kamekurae]SFT00793.1 Membrane protein involved in the export of O-antigen and teichoic acid [Halostagnicola kamekurae]
MSITEKLLDGFKETLGARVVNTVANGLLMLLLARVLLTPDEYGLLFLVIAIVAVLQLVADLGLSRSVARYISDRKETDPGSIPFLIRTSLRYRVLMLALVAGGIVFGRDLIAAVLDTPELSTLLVFGAGYLVCQSLYSYHNTVFQGFNRVQLSAVVETANAVLRVVAVVALTALGFGVAGALIGYAAGAALASIVGAVLLYRRFYTTHEDTGGSKSLRNRMLKYSIPMTASHSANVLDRRIDTVLVGYFLTPVAVSYYVLAKQISEFVLVPAGSLGFSISPTYGEQKANDSLEEAARIYEATLRSVLILYVPAAIGIVLVAGPAVDLVFGTAYAGATPVLQVFGVYVVFQAITSVTTNGLDYLGRARDRAIAKLVTSLGNVALNVVLIPIYGVVGAAYATVITFGIYTLINVYVMHLELSLDGWQIARSLALTTVVSAAMGLSVLVAVPYVSTIPSLAGVIALGVGIWAGLASISGLFDLRKTVGMLT